MKTRVLAAAIVVLAAAELSAAVKKTFRVDQKFTLAPGGTFVLENPVGNIEITGTDTPGIEAVVLKTIEGADDAAIAEGNQQTALIVGGDERTRVLRTTVSPNRTRDWGANVAWQLRVPRSVFVRVVSNSSQQIRLTNITGNVYVKNFNGAIVLDNVSGGTTVESVNGSIVYRTPVPHGNVALSTVNGHVTASVKPNTDLRWVAETIKGSIRTTLPVRGRFFGPTFRGSLNAPGGPTLTTVTLMGNVDLVGSGTSAKAAVPLQQVKTIDSVRAPQAPVNAGPATPRAGTFAQPLVRGIFRYATNLGDVKVQQIDGDADVFTGAGEVELGAVSGSCKVRSLGGPLILGEILGTLNASTRAGDVLIDSARRGGSIITAGGTIRLLYTAGPTRLVSGGGDITVRQALGAITAETRSGDVVVTLDRDSKTEHIEMKSAKGNLSLNVARGFGADIEAIILTTDPAGDTIVSEIPGLSISKEQDPEGRTRVRATGKLNGGGERVVLQTTDGDIRINIAPAGPTVVGR
ncbi:MAG TPA: DUF4097 family beta strand repeat-containing protein [Thermoanaerobaculia bacterium]|jgi:DUF4097 and DUF4098 domain-containing protein YvlB